MFTGIVETTGKIAALSRSGGNLALRITANLDEAIKIDQSIAHNGVCLTVTKIYATSRQEKEYEVVAVDETLKKTNLGTSKIGDLINIERCLKVGDRLDGHFVQGHVDTVGQVQSIEEKDGSWIFRFAFPAQFSNLLVQKGSVCINGVSLTVIDCDQDSFSVTIIPYTFEHTNFSSLNTGDPINLEFDILGKYLHKIYGKADY